MSATTSTAVVLLRPPSPKLGNFNDLFDDYLQRAAGTEPRIDVDEIIAHMEAVGKLDLSIDLNKLVPSETSSTETGGDGAYESLDKAKSIISDASSLYSGSTIKASLWNPKVATPRKASPRLVKAAKGQRSGPVREFRPSPLQDTVPEDDDVTPRASGCVAAAVAAHGTPHSSPETSDTMPCHYSIFDETPFHLPPEATPVTSPDAFYNQPIQSLQPTPTRQGKTPARTHFTSIYGGQQQTTVAYDYAAVGLGGFQTFSLQASSSTTQSNTTYSSNDPSASSHGVPLFGGSGFDGIFNKVISADALFRYRPFAIQSFPGAELYTVEPTKSGVDRIIPHYMSTREDKRRVLGFKLQEIAKQDREYEAQMPSVTGNFHVFVDASNVTIGFYETLKATHGIPSNKYVKPPPFCYEHLALVLERHRNVTKRVVAGSVPAAFKRQWPSYMSDAQDLGYEMLIMQRVMKAIAPTSRNHRLSSSLEPEWTASDANSSNDENFYVHLRQGEQGVDEVLHLKLMQSLADEEPGTIVLGTGDAAEAEFSDGFLKNVERLLKKSWNVEIMSWKATISKAWRDPEFLAKYPNQVRIIELDPFAEEILGAWFGAPGC